ncbi:hypothetical protein [Streptomyces sp. NPDC053048]|uniref:hypothetical protein n=1 Tax=Streptomyces sp. NPDC053048 TaxID=3365694 RepID=UPI0037D90011
MNAVPYAYDSAPGVPGFEPTHVVPKDGLSTWAAPDASVPTEPLDPLLPVQLLTRRGDWGQVLCDNGWAAWVDARLLVALPQSPPPAGAPLVRTADARRLLAKVEEALARYRRAVEELAAGRTDGETFHRDTHGLRIGAVVHGDALWLYDSEHDRWCYCDGTAMTTIAAREPAPQSVPPEATRLDSPASGPPPSPAPAPPPTRLGDS